MKKKSFYDAPIRISMTENDNLFSKEKRIKYRKEMGREIEKQESSTNE